MPTWFEHHPLLWVAAILLVGPPMLVSKFAASLPGLFGATARWWRNRRPIREGTVSRGELEDLREDVKRIREERRQDNADAEEARRRSREEISSLRSELDLLRRDFTEEKRIRWSAVGYVRVLIDSHLRHAPAAPIPDPPENLRELL